MFVVWAIARGIAERRAAQRGMEGGWYYSNVAGPLSAELPHQPQKQVQPKLHIETRRGAVGGPPLERSNRPTCPKARTNHNA